MGHKLNIIQRQYDKTGWHQARQFNVSEIQTIKVDGSGKGTALNSIPSPLARMHLFETAFEMVFQDLINSTKFAGDTYNKLVSDCLDVFELFYNWDSHIKDNKDLKLVYWKRDEEIRNLKSSTIQGHRLLGETLDAFLRGEEAFQQFDSCLMLKYNGRVIAGSSPFTGFITTPDSLTGLGLLKPLSQIAYFSRTIHFQDRNGEVKKFIYDFFENNTSLRSSPFTNAVRDFLDWHKNAGNIPLTTKLTLQPLISNDIEISVFGNSLTVAKSIGTQFFEPELVRMNYRLNDEYFVVPSLSNPSRTYDYLLPLTPAFFEEFDVKNVSEILTIKEVEFGTVDVTLNINGKLILKKYQQKPIHEQDGKIVDLFDETQFNFHLEVFPFTKVIGQPGDINFNDFYRVMLSVKDLHNVCQNSDFGLRFGKDQRLIEDGPVYKIKKTDRTLLGKNNSEVGSVYYSLNTNFDFVRIELPFKDQKKITGIVIPKWKEISLGNNQIDFSVDFGTTSTFIAFTNDPTHGSEPRAFELNDIESPVVQLHKPMKPSPQYRTIDRFEVTSLPVFNEAIDLQKKEFIPSIIKNKEKYEFPIRTVLYQKPGISSHEKEILSNANISFVFNKPDLATSASDQQFIPNLKWNIKTNSDYESSISAYIQEIFLLIRTKTLLNDGDPRKTRVIWFSPLSFTPASRRAYSDLWNRYSQLYLSSNPGNVYNLTESEAPFYYLFRNATINNPSSVLTLDIGGGSTDIMIFNQNEPILGTSVHFGANVLWGNGFSEFKSEKSNGIFLSIKKEITENLRSTILKRLNEEYCSSENSDAGSDEIINFWIENNEESRVLSKLNNGEFRLSYLLHLSALIFHTLKLLKAKNHPAPTCVIFSGNGSKYIDLIHDSQHIESIWGYFVKHVFGGGNKPQVILPNKNRKEATCYGGLFVPQSSANRFSTENYIGFESPDEKFLKYRDIENNKDQVFSKLLEVIYQFIDLFFQMNDVSDLNFRNEFGIESKLDLVKQFLKEKVAENLNVGYLKRYSLVDQDDLISDSMFYYPIVGLIYKMNNLSAESLGSIVARQMYYASTPDAENTFHAIRISKERKTDSLFIITITNEESNSGELSIIADPIVHKRALTVYQGNLDPVCVYRTFPEAGQTIKVLMPGKIVKQNDDWIVTQKMEIEFI